MTTRDLAHLAAARVGVPAAFAFEMLASERFVGGWALGSMGLQQVAPAVFRGKSLFDGSEAHVEIRPQPAHGLIDYAVGTAESRSARIYVRVTPGSVLGFEDGCCLVSLHAMRSATATDAVWARTCIVHETEILLIKAQLERARSGAGT